MKMVIGFLVVLLNLGISAEAFAQSEAELRWAAAVNHINQVTPDQVCNELKKFSRSSMNRLYIEASSERPPEGEFVSCELARPDGPLNSLVRWMADFSWNGMRYSADGNQVEVYLTKLDALFNKVIFKATGTYSLGTSFFDDNSSYVNEYRSVTYLPDGLAWMLRDEFREIRPGVYLGMTFARFQSPRGHVSSEYVGTIAIINKALLK